MKSNLDSGIYVIRNVHNGKVYIGSAVSVKRRWEEHRSRLIKGTHENDILGKSWKKHGDFAFEFAIIEQVFDVSRLIEREQFWINELKAADRKSGYNICPVAGNSLGVKRSPEARAKMSAVRKGWQPSDETRARMSIAQKGRVKSPSECANIAAAKRNMSAETKAKMSAAMKGKKQTPEQIARHALAVTGKIPSAETRAKLSLANRGQKRSAAVCAKMSAAQKGRECKLETREKLRVVNLGKSTPLDVRAKISAALIGRTVSPEVRAKLSLAAKARCERKAA